ncbi:Hypothetical predicted protein [Olea europaea subsp. europaea]|uniref:Uncharacterized protein n=1 Tax=Olea europaea subsp. europaea TaxID=158383 RepID=A0A8S0R327_OLEEU|nr:Hypothetical predicted protein [Olea europaea subsp. europaea]
MVLSTLPFFHRYHLWNPNPNLSYHDYFSLKLYLNVLSRPYQLPLLRRPLIAFVENCILKVGIHSFQQVIKPIMDDSIQKVSADNASPDEDLNDNPVYTGTEIKGKEGIDIKFALVDIVTEDPIDSGLESSRTNV